MEQHAKEQRQKILGQRNIRKRDTQATKADISSQTYQKSIESRSRKKVIHTFTTKKLPQGTKRFNSLLTRLQPGGQHVPRNGRQPRHVHGQKHRSASITLGPQRQHRC